MWKFSLLYHNKQFKTRKQQLQSMHKRKKEKTNIKKYGSEHAAQNAEVKAKIKSTNLEKFGSECPLQNEAVQKKTQATNLEKFQCEYPAQNETVREKFKATNLEKYGCAYPMQNCLVQEKMKATNREEFGCEYPMQNLDVQAKYKATNIETYGCENPIQNITVQNKRKATNLEKFGYEHPMQNAEFFAQQKKSGFKRKQYTFSSGKEVSIQGYEAYALNLLVGRAVKEEDLLLGFDEMPQIMYEHNKKLHRYYPDIFIPSQNKIVEVKSEYTYNIAQEITHRKIKACHDAGFYAEIWIFSPKGALLRVISDVSVDACVSAIIQQSTLSNIILC
jgi:hypothetical protein